MSRSATAEEIRRAYRLRARQVHPDRPGGDAEAMRVLNEAWRVLCNPRRRRAYDRSVADAGARPGPRPHTARRTAGAGAAEVVDPSGRASGRGDPLVLVPPAVLLAAVLVGSVGVVMASSGMLAAAALLGVLAGSAFVLAPIVLLRRDLHRRR